MKDNDFAPGAYSFTEHDELDNNMKKLIFPDTLKGQFPPRHGFGIIKDGNSQRRLHLVL
jgi:hypothetical protein